MQQAGQWSGVAAGFTAAAGETVKFAISLKAVGTTTNQRLGIYGDLSGWASANSSARILFGPGQLTQYVGGFWEVTGLSTTEATRIEVTRDFTQTQTGGTYFYVDNPGSYRGGEALIASNAVVTKANGHGENYKKLVRIDSPPPVSGGKPISTTFTYNAAGDVVETKTGVPSENLLDVTGWAGEKSGPQSGQPVSLAFIHGNASSRVSKRTGMAKCCAYHR